MPRSFTSLAIDAALSSRIVVFADACSMLDIIRMPVEHDKLHQTDISFLRDRVIGECPSVLIVCSKKVISEIKVNQEAEIALYRNKVREAYKIYSEQESRLNMITGSKSVSIDYDDNSDSLSTIALFHKVLNDTYISGIKHVDIYKAAIRSISYIPPASRKKDSLADCLIFSSYLRCMKLLRDMGIKNRFVFISSNKKDYCFEPYVNPHSEIANELSTCNATYEKSWKGLYGYV